MRKEQDPGKEGHTREWQDRARVVLDAKEAAGTEASPRQSPLPGEVQEDKKVSENEEDESFDRKDDSVY